MLDYKIIHIRTGGQTGVDEAGAKAGRDLLITTSVLAPKHWMFRTAAGIDLTDEIKFKERFNL